MSILSLSENLLLRAAPGGKTEKLKTRLQYVSFETGQQFWPLPGGTPNLLFPLRGAISLQLPASPSKRVEVAVVGREGFLEASLFLGGRKAKMLGVALTPGEAVILGPDAFRDFLTRSDFAAAVQSYVRLLIGMVSQISVCNRVHVIEKLCVSHLLLVHDRTWSDSFQITQDFFARVLGVRRATISRVVTRLQKHGAIQYDRRGRLTISDRDRLDQFACSCYRHLRGSFDRFVKLHGGM